jgi:uncharacterized protein YdeI (YjbR/CyaY-like superfamily)
MIKTWIEKLKALRIYAFMCSFFAVYWEETTMRINDNEVIELGGFILTIFVFLGGLFLLNYTGVISVF